MFVITEFDLFFQDCETCYSCSSAPYSSCSTVVSPKTRKKPLVKSVSSLGNRKLEIIATDSDSSLGTLSSIDSPQTAWKRNHENVAKFQQQQQQRGVKMGTTSLSKSATTVAQQQHQQQHQQHQQQQQQQLQQ